MWSNNFFWIAGSVSDAAGFTLSGISILLANGLCIFSIKGKSVFNNGAKNLPRNPPNSTILES